MLKKATDEELEKIEYNPKYPKKQNDLYYANKKVIFTLKMRLQDDQTLS